MTFVRKLLRELSDRRRFTGTVHANHKEHVRISLKFKLRRIHQKAFRFRAQNVQNFILRKRFAQSFFTECIRQKESSTRADIRFDQALFKLLEHFIGHLAFAGNALDFAENRIAGLLETRFNGRKETH